MKRITVVLLALVVVAMLAACGADNGTADSNAQASQGASSSSASLLDDKQLVDSRGEMASRAMLDIMHPSGSLYRKEVATGRIGEQPVIIFQIGYVTTTGRAGAFMAVDAYSTGLYYSATETLDAPKFYEVSYKPEDDVYAVLDTEVKIDDIHLEYSLYPVTLSGYATLSYSLTGEWLQALHDATFADWMIHRQAEDDWCGRYSYNAILFLSESGARLPGDYAAPESLQTALDDKVAGNTGDTLLFTTVCDMMALDTSGYWDLLRAALA